MSDATTVKVGQVYERLVGTRTRAPGSKFTITSTDGEHAKWIESDGAPNGRNIDIAEFCEDYRLVSDVSDPARDRSGCKAWCGWPYKVLNAMAPGTFRSDWINAIGFAGDGRDGCSSYCTSKCSGARLPPMPEAKAEAPMEVAGIDWGAGQKLENCCPCGVPNGHLMPNGWNHVCPRTAKPEAKVDAPIIPAPILDALNAHYRELAKTAKPEPAKAPKCQTNGCTTPTFNLAQRWSSWINDGEKKRGADLELLCERCYLLDEAEFAELTPSTGTPYTGPERLPRPRLAVDWVEDCL